MDGQGGIESDPESAAQLAHDVPVGGKAAALLLAALFASAVIAADRGVGLQKVASARSTAGADAETKPLKRPVRWKISCDSYPRCCRRLAMLFFPQ